MTTPTNPPAKHPPRRFVMKHWNLPGRHDVGTAFLSARQAGGEPCDEYLPLSEHTALLQEERARGREEGKADMLQSLSDEIDAMGADKAMFSVRQLMVREDAIRAKLAARSPGDAEK